MFLEKFQEKSGVQVQASRTSGALGPMPLTELLQIGAPTCFEKFTNRVGRAGGGGRKGARAGGLYRGPPALCTPLFTPSPPSPFLSSLVTRICSRTCRFCSAGEIYGVSEQAIPRNSIADHTRNNLKLAQKTEI